MMIQGQILLFILLRLVGIAPSRMVNRGNIESEGIGLTPTKKIVELYDGKIWLTSKLGVGSTFFFTLPKQMTAVSKSPRPAQT